MAGMSPANKTMLINGLIVFGMVLAANYVTIKFIAPRLEGEA